MSRASHSVVHPQPIAVATFEQTWGARQHDPELACATWWSDACRAWWQHEQDDRLRRRALEMLFVDAQELSSWHAMQLDERGLIRAHAHVIAMRAGVERAHVQRTLKAGALRATPVIAYTRGGGLFVFPHASEVKPAVARLASDLVSLPGHPFVRAAWLAHTVGAVHPFGDGNGGTMRLLASLELTRAWLPPFVLTESQRNTSYIDAVAGTRDLLPLLRVLYDAVQQELGALLLASGGDEATWGDATRARADRWIARVDRRWRGAVNLPLEVDESGAGSLARFAR
ncbi:MAG: Fic family protein, partial [Gemmatimonadota bacterium]|nr:Fic family protein [Gemmatimonadota bacterium]